MSAIKILDHIPGDQRHRAAELYWQAFGAKLSPALGARHRALPLLAHRVNTDRFLCAIDEGRVVGILGFHWEGSSGFDLTYGSLLQHYSGWSAWMRALLLMPLSRKPDTAEMLLDGLCVSAESRGQRIGTTLLSAAAHWAHDHDLRSVRLSVVDSNPRARALYLRSGFHTTRTDHLGEWGALYGFKSVDTMVRDIAEAAK